MRLLTIHAEKFWFKAREKALKDAEELVDVPGEARAENALVVFISVEEGDAKGGKEFLGQVARNVVEIAENVKADTIVLYPYAHLSSRLAPPFEAMEVMKSLEEVVKSVFKGKVLRAPFGWYKAFEIKCLGHPLSELSRELKPSAVKRVAIEKEYFILTPDGRLYRPEEYEFKEGEEGLKILVDKEYFKKELPGGKPRIVEICRKFGFEWEPMSDAGHMRYGPHATTILDAVMEYSWRVAKRVGFPVFRVRGTNMFNLKFRPVREHAELFGDRLYELRTDTGTMVMRYAACHQQFAMIKDWIISYRDLPFGAFEVADSYRYEQSGEVMLCFRLRKFFMPDLHIFNKDLEQAMETAKSVQEVILEEVAKVGQDYWAIYNVTRDFFDEHRDYIIELIRREGRPALIEVLPAGIYYWVLNIEYNIIDALGRPREIATFQIDIGNAKRFGIRYVDEEGNERYPVIIHTALIGGVERYIYMVFDAAVKQEARGKTPTIPVWLAPIQVRVIPVSRNHLSYAEEVLQRLKEEGIRADLDDRDLGLGKKIRDAGIEWIPYIVVVGDREVSTGTVNVRIRGTREQVSMKVDDLIKRIKEEVRGYPQVDSALPDRLSRRPTLHYLRGL